VIPHWAAAALDNELQRIAATTITKSHEGCLI